MNSFLRVKNIHKFIDQIVVLRNVFLELEDTSWSSREIVNGLFMERFNTLDFWVSEKVGSINGSPDEAVVAVEKEADV